MDGVALKKLLDANQKVYEKRLRLTEEAERYYENNTDIKSQERRGLAGDQRPDPIRQADNRISHRWHGLLTDQKAAYVATYPPLLDLGNKGLNQRVQTTLGDQWGRDFRRLAIQATNSGCAWVHVWEEEGARKYAPIDGKQLIPLYTKGLHRRLSGMLRQYQETDDQGNQWQVTEHWDNTICSIWRRKNPTGASWEPYPCLSVQDIETGIAVGQESTYEHRIGAVPFVPFPNNLLEKGDLHLMYKDLVDLYDRVDSGFANDIEDIQQIIFAVTGYGGEDPETFLTKLRKWKFVNLDGGMDENSKGDLKTITIDIPVEARNSLLDRLRQDILIFGQGVDPDPDKLGNATGVGIRHRYGLLELKAGALETEFRPGIAQLVRLLLPDLPAETPIKQTWTRNLIQNDLEQAQVLEMLAGVTSQQTLDENNPLVDDAEEEQKRREKDEKRQLARMPEKEPELFTGQEKTAQ